MKYKIKYIHEGRSCTNTLEAENFSVVRNTVVFYDEDDRSIYAFNFVVNVEKIEEGDNR